MDNNTGISNDTHGHKRWNRRRDFRRHIANKDFRIGVFTCKRIGALPSITVVCKLPDPISKSSPEFHSIIAAVSKKLQSNLSKEETNDLVDLICKATKATKSLSMAIVEYTCKAGIKTSRTQRESEIVKDFHSLITSSDSIDPSIFEDMRDYNIRGNTENKLYNVYFESMAKVIEGMGVSAEARRHASSSEIEAQGGMSYIPFATSVRELMQKTDDYLETRSIQCPRPSNSWVGFQFLPVDATRRTAERYTGLLKVVRVLSKKQAASFHQHAHWCAKNAKNWKIEAVALRKAIIEASDTNIVIPSYPYGGLVACGQDDKSSIGVGRDIAVQATSKQSTSSIMPVGTSLLACDHDYVVEKVVASVLHWMNVGESENESMYSGGENGHGRTQVALHDATLEKSTGFKHMAHLFQAINERSKQNCVECEGDDDNWTDYIPYVVMNETDGGPDHNIQFLSQACMCRFLSYDSN